MASQSSGFSVNIIDPNTHDGFLVVFWIEISKSLDSVIDKATAKLISIDKI